MNDIVVNKVQSVQRCVERAREEYALAGKAFREDHSRQDAAVLNITRACEQAIDLANHLIKTGKMGVPTDSADSFALLSNKGVISRRMEEKMRGMVGFRNVAVHVYRDLDIDIVEAVIRTGLNDLVEYTDAVVEYVKNSNPEGGGI